MCIILQRYYHCGTRDGRYVNTEQELENQGQCHYPHRSLVSCSTPLMVPKINEEVNDETVLPCHGAMDTKVEWYNEPCPECLGNPPYMYYRPIREEWQMFNDTIDEYGRGSDPRSNERTRLVTERAAESLARMFYCWISVHWSSDLLNPETVEARDMPKEIASTRHDMICIEEPSHGSAYGLVGCPCPWNQAPSKRNVAIALRHWTTRQTMAGQREFLDLAGYLQAEVRFDRDLHDLWTAIPNDVWARNPFFEFDLAENGPDHARGEALQRVEHGSGPTFGVESALWDLQNRTRRLQIWESRRDPPLLKSCKPLTELAVAARLAELNARIAGRLQHRQQSRNWWWAAGWVLEKSAEILAHDSGLTDYRIRLVIDHLLRSFEWVTEYHSGPSEALYRPAFTAPYADALFELVLSNPNTYSHFYNRSIHKNMILRDVPGDPDFDDYPFWVVPDPLPSYEERVQRWRLEYWEEVQRLHKRAQVIDDHIVKYIPGLLSDYCTSCTRYMGRRWRGSQLCGICMVRTGWTEGLEFFGDDTFFAKTERGAGPMESWQCFLCSEDPGFVKNDPPVEVPAETIRCHGKHNSEVCGSICLRKALMTTGDPVYNLPRCPLDREALSQWDQNILDGNEEDNNDHTMNPWRPDLGRFDYDIEDEDYDWGDI